MRDKTKMSDRVVTTMSSRRKPEDGLALSGMVIAELRGPDGELKARCVTHNLITEVGDEYYGERAAGIATPPDQVTGMKLGTGTTLESKTGAGAGIVTYLSDSQQAIDAAFPQSVLNAGARRITWEAVWAAGKATTVNPIEEAVITNQTPLADDTSLAAVVISRALLIGIGSKGAEDTLTITWHHDLLGA